MDTLSRPAPLRARWRPVPSSKGLVEASVDHAAHGHQAHRRVSRIAPEGTAFHRSTRPAHRGGRAVPREVQGHPGQGTTRPTTWPRFASRLQGTLRINRLVAFGRRVVIAAGGAGRHAAAPGPWRELGFEDRVNPGRTGRGRGASRMGRPPIPRWRAAPGGPTLRWRLPRPTRGARAVAQAGRSAAPHGSSDLQHRAGRRPGWLFTAPTATPRPWRSPPLRSNKLRPGMRAPAWLRLRCRATWRTESLANGSPQPLLERWAPPPQEIHAVFPPRHAGQEYACLAVASSPMVVARGGTSE